MVNNLPKYVARSQRLTYSIIKTNMEIMNLTDSSEIGDSSDFKSCYEPPLIEVVEVTVEKGFANSITDYEEDTW